MDDQALLRQYLDERDERAFALLVGRYVDLVYSAARRQSDGDESLAQDITQTVFICLAQKAGTIRRGEALAGWLLATTRFAALNARRAEARRRRHEHEAATMKFRQRQADDGHEPDWESIGPLLDEAIAKLKRQDRDAVVLRYFQGLSASEIASALDVSPEAAQKRVSRAIGRLRRYFAARGITASNQGLANVLSANAVAAAPQALRETIGTAIMSAMKAGTTAAGAGAGGTSASSITIGKGVSVVMAAAKIKIVAACAACVLLAGITGTIAYQQVHGMSARQVRIPPAPAKPIATGNWQAKIRAVYALKPGEFAKRIPPPFIPERRELYLAIGGNRDIVGGPGDPKGILMTWADGDALPKMQEATFGGVLPLESLLENLLKIDSWDMDRSAGPILGRRVSGDWVVRAGGDSSALRADVIAALSKAIGAPLRLEKRDVLRQAIVVRGSLQIHPVNISYRPNHGPKVLLYLHPPTKRPRMWLYDSSLFHVLAQMCQRPVLFDGPGIKPNLEVQIDPDAFKMSLPASPPTDQQIDELLVNVAKQTSLQLTRERRVLPTWFLTKGP